MKAHLVIRPFVLGAVVAAALAGCANQVPAINDEVHIGPFYTPKNYTTVKALPAELRRVVVLPVFVGSNGTLESAAMLDAAVFTSLVRQQRFEVVAATRAECQALWGRPEFNSAATLPPGFVEKMAERHGAGGVLFVDLTDYRPYQPQSLGLRAKLAVAADAQVLWSFDEVFSASDSAVRNSARRRYFELEHGNRPFDLSLAGMQSPTWFANFVTNEVFATLPAR